MNTESAFLTKLQPGQIISRYRVLRFVGRGAMGEVYLAEHLPLNRPVAVKVLNVEGSGAEAVDRFLNEARICSRIEHPNVVTIHDVGFDAGLHFIIMQYVDGLNLDELVRDLGGPLPWQAAVRLIRQAARGVAAVHNRSLVHQDVKPGNIMLARDSRALLMDFGLVRDPSAEGPRKLMGTPAYMSPEQCRGGAVDGRSDLFSLGATLYFLLVGKPPFEGTVAAALQRAHRDTPPPDLLQANPAVPLHLAEVVAWALDPRPASRFPTAASLIAALSGLLECHPGNNLPRKPE